MKTGRFFYVRKVEEWLLGSKVEMCAFRALNSGVFRGEFGLEGPAIFFQKHLAQVEENNIFALPIQSEGGCECEVWCLGVRVGMMASALKGKC